jgi:hypothetical protein
MIQGRYRLHEDSSQVHHLLGPNVPKPLPRNYHKENLLLMKKKEQEMQERILSIANNKDTKLNKLK